MPLRNGTELVDWTEADPKPEDEDKLLAADAELDETNTGREEEVLCTTTELLMLPNGPCEELVGSDAEPEGPTDDVETRADDDFVT